MASSRSSVADVVYLRRAGQKLPAAFPFARTILDFANPGPAGFDFSLLSDESDLGDFRPDDLVERR